MDLNNIRELSPDDCSTAIDLSCTQSPPSIAAFDPSHSLAAMPSDRILGYPR